MIKKAPAWALVFVIFVCFASCAHNANLYREIDANVRDASFEDALRAMEQRNVKRSIYTDKNAVLYYLDRGMLEHYAELWQDSSRSLQEGESLIEAAFTRSISREMASFILNDNAIEYSGEDYEDIYINVFNALNYYRRNDLEGAMVEIRRVNEKLTFLSDKYETARARIADANPDLDGPDYVIEAVRFSNSALARYLSLLFYRARGDTDNARVDLEELYQAFELAPDVYNHPPPSSLAEELAIPDGKARLNLLAFTGLSPVKEEVNLPIPMPLPPPNSFARLALPRMVNRPSDIEYVEIILNSGERFRLELLEDMSRVAMETFKARYSLVVLKTTARTISKTVAGAALAYAARENSEGLSILVGLAARLAADFSERADTRISRYFPGRAYTGGVTLEPGTYSVTVNYNGRRGIVASERIDNVSVQAGRLNLIQLVNLK